MPKDMEKQKQNQREWYLRNKAAIAERQKVHYAKRIEEVRDLKRKPCTDCGIEYPYYVMQFDHIGDDKINSVAGFMRNREFSKAKAEALKCEVVCANCHATRTWQRKESLVM
jgi:hypothetical protein